MKIEKNKLGFFVWSFFQLVFLEVFFYVLNEKAFLGLSISRDHINQLFFIYFLFLLIQVVYFISFKIVKRGRYIDLLLPLLLNAATVGFVFFVPLSVPCQVAIVLNVFSLLTVYFRLDKFYDNYITVTIQFLAILLSIFNLYSLIYYFGLPYWFISLVLILFSFFVMMYFLRNEDLKKEFRNLFLVLITIIASEFFLVSFLIPIGSIIVKSIFVSMVFYTFASVIKLYFKNKMNIVRVSYYLVVSIIVLALSVISIYIKSGGI